MHAKTSHCIVAHTILSPTSASPAPPAGPVENESPLRTRRALLMEGLAASLRLPETAVVAPPPAGGAPAAAGGEAAGDGVFLRLMSLYKGKRLLARALGVVYPSPEAAAPRHSALVDGDLPALPQRPNLRVVWAALRHLRYLFAGKPGNAEDAAVTAAVATALAEVLRRLHSPDAVADCLAAVLAGDLDGAPLMDTQPDAVLMPLYAPGGLPCMRLPERACPCCFCSGDWLAGLHAAQLADLQQKLRLACSVKCACFAEPYCGQHTPASCPPLTMSCRRQRARHAAPLAGGRADRAAAACRGAGPAARHRA